MKKILTILLGICLLVTLIGIPAHLLQAAEFNRNFIISDAELFDIDSMNKADIQKFLELKNSTLADFVTKDVNGIDRSAAEIIYNAAQTYGINPKFILVMLQKEQSIIEDPNPSAKQYDWAMGYAICDSCSMNDPALLLFKGFGAQVDRAIARIKWYGDNSQYFKQIGQEYEIDGHIVIPANRATANLYNYTPHIHGNYLFWKIWQRWFKQYYPDGSLLQAKDEPGVWLLEYGFKRPFLNKGALVSRYDINKIIVVDKTELDKYETGTPIKFSNYSLLHQPDGKIFLLVDDHIRHIDTMETFRWIGFNPEEIISVDFADLAIYNEGSPITIKSAYPMGALLKNIETGGVYYVEDGVKHSLIAVEILQINYPNYSLINVTAEELDQYEEGVNIKFIDGTLLKSPTDPRVYVVSNGKKRPVATEKDFLGLKYEWNKIHTVSEKALSNLPLGEVVDLSFKDNSL